MAKPQRQKPIVSPPVILKFPKVTEPDMSEYSIKKYPTGLFKTGAVFKPGRADMDAFISLLQDFYDTQVAALKAEKKKVFENKFPWIKADTEKNEDGDKVETGLLTFEAKLPAHTKADPAKGKIARPQRPILIDSQMNPMSTDAQIWGGSTAKLSVLPGFYNEAGTGSGVTLRLVGVQVLNLVAGGGHTATSAGFGEEDGYVVEGAPDTQAPAGEDAEGEDKPF